MRIVVLDGHTLNPGDLSWDSLARLGALTVHERTAPGEVVARAAGAAVVLTNKTVLTREQLARLPELRLIGVLATGYNVVDTAAARERGIPVCNVPDYGTRSVAQFTFALLLELAHHVGHHAATTRAGRWSQSPDFCYWDRPQIELEGLTLGLIGLGRIGRAVADLGHAFGMKVVTTSRRRPDDLPAHLEFVSLDDLLARSDVVSLHCPLTSETKHLIGPANLAKMRRNAFLLNTGRGPLVDDQALAEALRIGTIAGAAVDVLTAEPPAADNPLLQAPNCLVTPHIAWATRAARARLMETAVGNVEAFLGGSPRNVVN